MDGLVPSGTNPPASNDISVREEFRGIPRMTLPLGAPSNAAHVVETYGDDFRRLGAVHVEATSPNAVMLGFRTNHEEVMFRSIVRDAVEGIYLLHKPAYVSLKDGLPYSPSPVDAARLLNAAKPGNIWSSDFTIMTGADGTHEAVSIIANSSEDVEHMKALVNDHILGYPVSFGVNHGA
jgi:hypothetical protein